MNKVLQGKEARKAILSGAKILCEAVETSFGPNSGTVGILGTDRKLTSTQDGATVARSIILDGELAAGVDVIQSVAGEMEDASSTATILSYYLLEEADILVGLGQNPLVLRKKLNEDLKILLDYLPTFSRPAEDKLAQVGETSTGNKERGELVAEVISRVGKTGVVVVETTENIKTTYEITQGFSFDKGLISAYMITDPINEHTVLEDAHIIITREKLITTEEVVFFTSRIKDKKSLLIIAEDFSDEALKAMLDSTNYGICHVVGVKSPGFGTGRLDILEDISAFTGSTLHESGTEPFFGHLDKATISQTSTILIAETDTKKERIAQIDAQIKKATSDYEEETLTERRAALEGTVATISVGGNSQVEVKEIKDKIDDAVYSVRNALDGVVPGCGTVLLDLAKVLDDSSLLKKVLPKPFSILLRTVGLEASDYEAGNGKGVDLLNPNELVDLWDAGIIEATKVTEEVLRNVVSIVGTAMTMQTLIIPEDTDD